MMMRFLERLRALSFAPLALLVIAGLLTRCHKPSGSVAPPERFGSGIRVSGNDAVIESTETGVIRAKVAGADAMVVTSAANYTFLGTSFTAGTGAPPGTPAEGALYLRRLGSAGTSDLFVGISGAWVSTTTGSSGFVPSARSLSTTAPLTIDGSSSADLSANRTLAVSNATTGAVGVLRLAQDLAGSGTAPTVIAITGTAGDAALHATSFTEDTGQTFTLKGANFTTSAAAAPDFVIRGANATGTGATTGSQVTLQTGTGNTDGRLNLYTGAGTAGTGTIVMGISATAAFSLLPSFMQVRHNTQILLDSDALNIRSGGSSSKGFWNNTGLRIGDGTGATHILETSGGEIFHNGSFFTFGGTVTSPLISQAAASNANGQPMEVVAQSGNGSNKNGGPLYLFAGDKTGAGTPGSVFLGVNAGSTTVLGATTTGVDIYKSFITFQPTVASPLITQAAPSGANGQSMNIVAQAGNGTDKNGGPLYLYGGEASGAGVPGTALIQSGDSSTGITVEAATLTSELRHVVALAKHGQVTATQMPSNTGDFVIYIANASSSPTASAVGGGILYVESGALKYRGSSGTTTTLGNPFWSPDVEGMPANDNGIECEPWQRECAGWR